jgi:hypothetical protein
MGWQTPISGYSWKVIRRIARFKAREKNFRAKRGDSFIREIRLLKNQMFDP